MKITLKIIAFLALLTNSMLQASSSDLSCKQIPVSIYYAGYTDANSNQKYVYFDGTNTIDITPPQSVNDSKSIEVITSHFTNKPSIINIGTDIEFSIPTSASHTVANYLHTLYSIPVSIYYAGYTDVNSEQKYVYFDGTNIIDITPPQSVNEEKSISVITNQFTSLPILEDNSDCSYNVALDGWYDSSYDLCTPGSDIKLHFSSLTNGNACEGVLNQAPVANAGVDQTVLLGDSVTLDAVGSTDSDGSIVSYEWKEGDAVLSTNSAFTKSDFTEGYHGITLSVTDDDGTVDSDTVLILVSATGEVAFNYIWTQTDYDAKYQGNSINYDGSKFILGAEFRNAEDSRAQVEASIAQTATSVTVDIKPTQMNEYSKAQLQLRVPLGDDKYMETGIDVRENHASFWFVFNDYNGNYYDIDIDSMFGTSGLGEFDAQNKELKLNIAIVGNTLHYTIVSGDDLLGSRIFNFDDMSNAMKSAITNEIGFYSEVEGKTFDRMIVRAQTDARNATTTTPETIVEFSGVTVDEALDPSSYTLDASSAYISAFDYLWHRTNISAKYMGHNIDYDGSKFILDAEPRDAEDSRAQVETRIIDGTTSVTAYIKPTQMDDYSKPQLMPIIRDEVADTAIITGLVVKKEYAYFWVEFENENGNYYEVDFTSLGIDNTIGMVDSENKNLTLNVRIDGNKFIYTVLDGDTLVGTKTFDFDNDLNSQIKSTIQSEIGFYPTIENKKFTTAKVRSRIDLRDGGDASQINHNIIEFSDFKIDEIIN